MRVCLYSFYFSDLRFSVTIHTPHPHYSSKCLCFNCLHCVSLPEGFVQLSELVLPVCTIGHVGASLSQR